VAAKYPNFNFNIDDISVKGSIKIIYDAPSMIEVLKYKGPSIDLIEEEFRMKLPAAT
jgi:hypothetical protein